MFMGMCVISFVSVTVMMGVFLTRFQLCLVFVIVPDCGRDANPLMGVPFQHHFNTKSAHEIWALVFGALISPTC